MVRVDFQSNGHRFLCQMTGIIFNCSLVDWVKIKTRFKKKYSSSLFISFLSLGLFVWTRYLLRFSCSSAALVYISLLFLIWVLSCRVFLLYCLAARNMTSNSKTKKEINVAEMARSKNWYMKIVMLHNRYPISFGGFLTFNGTMYRNIDGHLFVQIQWHWETQLNFVESHFFWFKIIAIEITQSERGGSFLTFKKYSRKCNYFWVMLALSYNLFIFTI